MPKGLTVLQAAESIGIDVPTLCNHEILEPVGACRMCVVEIAPGPPRPMASCTTPAADGMTVKTNTDEMQQIRRQTIELLLQQPPARLPYCDQSGTCELQDETFGLNIWSSPFETVSKAFPEENLNEVIMINHNRCILCYRCVRVCDEQMGVHALDVSDRGSKSFIVTAQHKFMDCERCGMCVEVCPVGAVLSRRSSTRRGLADCPDPDDLPALLGGLPAAARIAQGHGAARQGAAGRRAQPRHPVREGVLRLGST